MMLEAEVVNFDYTLFILDDSEGDSKSSMPAKAIYVPSNHLLLETYLVVRTVREANKANSLGDNSTGYLQMYKVFFGEEAQDKYRLLLEKLKEVKPENIQVPESLVDWAHHLYHAKNPPKELTELLTNKVS